MYPTYAILSYDIHLLIPSYYYPSSIIHPIKNMLTKLHHVLFYSSNDTMLTQYCALENTKKQGEPGKHSTVIYLQHYRRPNNILYKLALICVSILSIQVYLLARCSMDDHFLWHQSLLTNFYLLLLSSHGKIFIKPMHKDAFSLCRYENNQSLSSNVSSIYDSRYDDQSGIEVVRSHHYSTSASTHEYYW